MPRTVLNANLKQSTLPTACHVVLLCSSVTVSRRLARFPAPNKEAINFELYASYDVPIFIFL